MITRILRNESYTGLLIQGVKKKVNYRTNKLVDVSRDEWIRTPNHHEPIMSKEKFDEVQKILNKKIKVNNNTILGYAHNYTSNFLGGLALSIEVIKANYETYKKTRYVNIKEIAYKRAEITGILNAKSCYYKSSKVIKVIYWGTEISCEIENNSEEEENDDDTSNEIENEEQVN